VTDLLPSPAPGDRGIVAREDVSSSLAAVKALLDHPALARDVGLAVLSRMALDENAPAKERRRCGEVLAQLKVRATELWATLTGAKEQRLKDLGLEAGPQEVHVEQHNTRIEIVREGARDWRTVEPS